MSNMTKITEVDRNFEAFQQELPELLKTHPGKFVVLRKKEAVAFFDTFRDAMIYGTKTYQDELFSVQEVTDKALDLGWFSDVYISGAVRH